jgi:hypothetical protein
MSHIAALVKVLASVTQHKGCQPTAKELFPDWYIGLSAVDTKCTTRYVIPRWVGDRPKVARHAFLRATSVVLKCSTVGIFCGAPPIVFVPSMQNGRGNMRSPSAS